MSSNEVGRFPLAVRLAMATAIVVSFACAKPEPIPPPPATGAVTGAVRVIERPGADTVLGPIVVMLEPLGEDGTPLRPPRSEHIASSTHRFDPGFAALALGDSIIFVNTGPVSHRFFTTDLPGVEPIPVGPTQASRRVPVQSTGELRFFCSLHPEENFAVLVTRSVLSTVAADDGRYDIRPVADGTYRLSIWTRKVQGPVRVVEVVSGRPSVETIWIDPDLIRR